MRSGLRVTQPIIQGMVGLKTIFASQSIDNLCLNQWLRNKIFMMYAVSSLMCTQADFGLSYLDTPSPLLFPVNQI